MSRSQPTALITGGSSGIGFELAKLFAQDHFQLLIVAKFAEELEATAAYFTKHFPDTPLHCLQQDLCLSDAAPAVHQHTQQLGLQIDVLVNNAGFGTYGFINDIDPQREQDMIALNIQAVYALTRIYLQEMVARDEGRILNISSISAFQPNPFLTTYGATKAFVHSFSRATNFELKSQGSKVRITTVCPPPVRTGFQKAAGMECSKLFDSWMTVPAGRVARDAYRAMQQGRDMIVPGGWLHYLNMLSRRLPTRWLMHFASFNLKEKKS
ncbi:MAG: SDR family oxidoreductase [Bacteroidota bacterium]